MTTNKHWGEFLEPDTEAPELDFTAELEFAMTTTFFDEYEDTKEVKPTKIVTVPPLNRSMLHAINLHAYNDRISDLIQAKVKVESAHDLNIPTIENVTPCESGLNFTKDDFRQFKNGKEVTLPQFSNSLIKQIGQKFVATMLSSIGYESSPQEALDILTDVLQEFLVKITRKYSDSLRFHDGLSPLDKVEKLLVETGFNGVKGLDDYYQSRVVKYLNVLEQRCKETQNNYVSLFNDKPESPIQNINDGVKVKIEKEDDDEVTEIEDVLVLDGKVNPSVMEVGFQLLRSFETNNWNQD